MIVRQALQVTNSNDDEKFIALTDDRVAAAGFTIVKAIATSSSAQMPFVAKANSVEER
ncbi:MAG: hypothetical protein PUP91_07040 [Rhizonema sp. PD37]|nr:hypothetical protein [Rhizonema sp. PD37]